MIQELTSRVLSLFHFYQVGDFIDHPHNLRGCFMNNRLADFAQAQRLDGSFLPLRAINDALNLRNFNLTHRLEFMQGPYSPCE